MIQFYSPLIAETLALPPDESMHCIRVLRKRAGDEIFVTDGLGKRFKCRIVDANPKSTGLEILSETVINKKWKCEISLIVAPTKNSDRMAWLVEKATEIGIDRILFVKTRNTERTKVNIERLRRNAISAMNQSLKTRLPQIEELGAFKSMITMDGERFFGYCDSETERQTFVKELKPKGKIVIAIGPEGDFSTEEVRELIQSGYKAVTFGEERLRTETAALYAVTAIHVKEDLIKELI